MPCLGCEKCKVEKWCINEADDWNAIVKKVLECDVLVIGSPTYYYDVCGQLKNFIDRTYSLYHDRKLAGRKGVAVAVHANKGASRTIQTIEGFLSAHEFASLGSVKGTGYHEGAVLDDTEAVQKAQKIGDKIVRLVKRHNCEIEQTRQSCFFPVMDSTAIRITVTDPRSFSENSWVPPS